MDRFDGFLKQRADKEIEENHIMALLTDSNYVKKLRSDRDAERVNEQSLELQKLEPHRRRRDQELPKWKAARIKAEEKTRKCKEALDEAEKERSAAASEESSLGWLFDHQEELIIAKIKSLAPACINHFISELHQLENDARAQVRTDIRESRPNPITGRVTQRFESNIKSIETRVNAIRAARSSRGVKARGNSREPDR